jgi:hypothetical protein
LLARAAEVRARAAVAVRPAAAVAGGRRICRGIRDRAVGIATVACSVVSTARLADQTATTERQECKEDPLRHALASSKGLASAVRRFYVQSMVAGVTEFMCVRTIERPSRDHSAAASATGAPSHADAAHASSQLSHDVTQSFVHVVNELVHLLIHPSLPHAATHVDCVASHPSLHDDAD